MMKTITKIEAIIFDLGKVLVDVDLKRGIFKYTLQGKPQSEKQILDSLMRDSFYREYACGRVTPKEFHRKFCSQLNLDLDFNTFKQAWNDVFKPIVGMNELVRQLSTSYKIGLLSDIGPLHWEHLKDTLPALQIIAKPILSYQIGHLKPDPETYQAAMNSVDKPPQKCLFIDDREINVAGAKSIGMQAVQFTGLEKLKQDLVEFGILYM